MSFNLQVKIDTSDAPTAVQKVGAALTSMEASAKSAGDVATKGMKDSAQAAKDSSGAATDAAKAFAGLTDQFKREADMLEKIRGPMRDYQADLSALDMLMKKNTISGKEYEDQLDRLKTKAGIKPPEGSVIEGSVGQAAAGQFGEVGNVIGSLASKGAVEAAALAGIAVEAVRLGDEYITLANSAQRYAGASGDVDAALNQQLSMSKDLHAGLEQTLELSTVVKERTEDMGLSAQETAAFTRELGEAVELSGHSLGEASSVIGRVSFALESGLPAGREMKNIMREYPAIADALKEHFGTGAKEIVEMANKGKISLNDLRSSLDDVGASLTSQMGERTETVSQQWQHFKDTLVLTVGKLVENSGIIQALGKVLGALASGLELVADAFHAVGDAASWVKDKLGPIGDVLGDIKDRMIGLNPFGGLMKSAQDVIGDNTKIEAATQKWDDFFRKFGAGISIIEKNRHAWEDWFKVYGGIVISLDPNAFNKSVNALTDGVEALISKSIGAAEAIGKIVTTKDGLRTLADPWHVASDAVKAHAAAIDADQAVLNKINGPMETASAELGSLSRLMGQGKINAQQFEDAVSKLYATIGKAPTGITEKLGYQIPQADLASVPTPQKLAPSDESVVGGKESLKTYFEDQQKITAAQAAGSLSPTGLSQSLQDLHDKYDDMRSPLDKFADGMKLVNEKLKEHIYNADEAERALRQLREAAGTSTFGDGIVNGFDKIKKSAMDTATTISTAMKGAFDDLNADIVSMVTTGTADWSKLASTIEADLAKIALQKIEASAISAFSDTAATTGAVTATALGAARYGADFDVPYYAASGANWVVGGQGPTDSKMAMFHVTPGEHVSVRTPDQMNAARNAQSSGGPVNLKIVNQSDDRGALAGDLKNGVHDRSLMNVMKRNKNALQEMLK